MAENSIIKKIFSSEGMFNEAQLKIFRYLLVLVLVGVLIFIMGDFSRENIVEEPTNDLAEVKEKDYNSDYKTKLETKLSSLLTQIEGTGEVSVDITFDTSSEYIYVRNEEKNTNETRNETGDLESFQKDFSNDVVVLKKQNKDEALVKKEIKPKIRGVLIVAQGADEIKVKSRLLEAVQVGLGVEAHKIAILPKD